MVEYKYKLNLNLKNKKVFISGSTKGIGYETARLFLEEGALVTINGRTKYSVDDALSKLNNKNASGIITDFLDDSQVEKLTDEIPHDIDILINNAGITGPTASLWEYDIEEWKKVVNINLMGTFNCCKAIVPNMIKNNYGRIVNVASVAGKDGNANASAYSAGKAGAIGLTKSLGKELADKNIAVNAVTPAGAKTRILDQMTKEHVQRMLSKVPRGRFLEVEEFTSLICWLSSEENTFSTAAVFDISGGRSTY